MAISKLATYTKLSPNYTKMTNKKNKKITIHHMAGNLSIESCGNVFASKSRKASSNYGIGSDGRIGCYVDEDNRSWCSSSSANDSQAITIEVANCGGAPNWPVSDKAYDALLDLCEDICRRNGIKELVFTGDATGNLTQHNYFANTNCPGPYLKARFQAIADEVNKRLKNDGAADDKITSTVKIEMDVLQRGVKGEQVKTLQRLLNANDCSVGSSGADGSFGPATEKALKAYQKKKGLAQDGSCGPATWNKILKG